MNFAIGAVNVVELQGNVLKNLQHFSYLQNMGGVTFAIKHQRIVCILTERKIKNLKPSLTISIS